MYWSNFSPAWYELTLEELGFELLTKFKEDKNFLGERETTWCIILNCFILIYLSANFIFIFYVVNTILMMADMLFRIPDDDAVAFSFFGTPSNNKDSVF